MLFRTVLCYVLGMSMENPFANKPAKVEKKDEEGVDSSWVDLAENGSTAAKIEASTETAPIDSAQQEQKAAEDTAELSAVREKLGISGNESEPGIEKERSAILEMAADEKGRAHISDAFSAASPEVLQDKKFVLNLLGAGQNKFWNDSYLGLGEGYKKLPAELQGDPGIAKAAMMRDIQVMKYFPDSLKTDPQIAEYARQLDKERDEDLYQKDLASSPENADLLRKNRTHMFEGEGDLQMMLQPESGRVYDEILEQARNKGQGGRSDVDTIGDIWTVTKRTIERSRERR